jgi:hypothetical protein
MTDDTELHSSDVARRERRLLRTADRWETLQGGEDGTTDRRGPGSERGRIMPVSVHLRWI